MDWVKPKYRARQLKKKEQPENEIAAGAWLQQLCEDKVALLQASLPNGNRKQKRTKASLTTEIYVDSVAWGTGLWETESDTGLGMLQDLVHSFGTNSIRSKTNRVVQFGQIAPNQIAHAKKIGTWITQNLPRASYDPYVALTCAGWVHALPSMGREISPTLWLEVLQSIMTQVDRGWESGPEDGLFPWIIWSCEIPLALAKHLSHLGGKDRIVSDSLNRIAQLLEESAENPTSVMHRGGQDLRAILASVVRSRWSATEVGARKWFPPQRKAIIKLATQALALTDPFGRQLLFDQADTRLDTDFWLSIYELSEKNAKFATTLACALPNEVGRGLGLKPQKLRKDKTIDVTLTKHSQYWEKSSVATMRRSWRDHGCRVAIDFSTDVIWLDVMADDGTRIFSGDWDVTVERDGKTALIDHAWQELCWFTDDDVDYLELECSVGDECKIQRQIMLIRDEGMIFFADALIAKEAAQWKISSSWTLSQGVRFMNDPKMNECRLMRANADEDNSAEGVTKALLIPVAMPEWKRGTKAYSMDCHRDQLQLTASTTAKNLYSPLVVPLRNLDKPLSFTWRQLTVAEELQIQPRDIADAYRLQINTDQWLFYRSLTPCTRRTVMGLHLNTEFYAGRFCSSDGQFESIVEVNPDE